MKNCQRKYVHILLGISIVFLISATLYEIKRHQLADLSERIRQGEILTWDMSEEETKCRLDLDGDGKVEDIFLTSSDELQEVGNGNYFTTDYIIQIGNSEYQTYCDNAEPVIMTYSPDGMEILLAVFDEGPSGDPITKFYRYADKKVMEAGEIPGDIRTLEINDKVVKCSFRGDMIQTRYTWGYWMWDGNKMVMRQDEEYENIDDFWVTLLEPLQVFPEKDETGTPITLEPQKVVDTKSDLKEWVYLVGEDGTEGWIRVKYFQIPSLNNKNVEEVFEGRTLAG